MTFTIFLTGAGLSANSGLPTYRGVGGVYTDAGAAVNGMPIEEFLSYDNWLTNPSDVETYKDELSAKFAGANPSDLHRAIAVYQEQDTESKVFTQNIDDLHERAGSINIVHLHGSAADPVLFGMNISDESVQEMESVCMNTGKLFVIGTSVQFPYLEGWISEMITWGAELVLLDTNPDHKLKAWATVHETDPAAFVATLNYYLSPGRISELLPLRAQA